MTLNEMAYRKGSRDAQDKFAAVGAGAAPALPAAGGLSAIPPISTAVPGAGAASVKPGAPNQALPTSPVLGTGVPGMPTVAGMGKTQTQGAAIAAPPTAAPATPSVKAASVFAPSAAPKAAKIPRATSTVRSNNTTETANSVSPSTTPSSTPASSSSSATSTPVGGGTAGPQMGGIVPSTGQVPAAALANSAAESFGNQTRATAGGGK